MSKNKKQYVPAEIEVTRLEDCPHCGGKAELKAFRGMFLHGWVGCPECGIYKQWSVSPVEAVKIWNRREDNV